MTTMGDTFSAWDDINPMINNNNVMIGDKNTMISNIHVTNSV